MKPLVVDSCSVEKIHVCKSIEIRKKLKQKCGLETQAHRILERREGGKTVECFNDPKEICHERNNVILLIKAADLHGVGLQFLAHAS